MKLRTITLMMFTIIFLAGSLAIAEEPSEPVKRLDSAATVLSEVMSTPDKGIPEELLDSARTPSGGPAGCARTVRVHSPALAGLESRTDLLPDEARMGSSAIRTSNNANC